jgi:hypothetical protein
LDDEDMQQLTDFNNFYNPNLELFSKIYFLVNYKQEELKEFKECIPFKELTTLCGMKQNLRKGTILELLKETSMETVSKQLENQTITTLYNKKMDIKYNFIKFETNISVIDKIIPLVVNNEEVRVSLVTFLKEKYNLTISDEYQPIIQCKRNDKVFYLVPEYSGILFGYHKIIKSISYYLNVSLNHMSHLKKFQQDFEIQFNDPLLLRQW